MRVSHLVLVLLGSTAAAVLVPGSSTGNQVTQKPPNDRLGSVIGMFSKAKAPAKPKTPSKPPAAPSQPKVPPVQSAKPTNEPVYGPTNPAKPTKPSAGSTLGQSTLKTLMTSTPAAKSAPSALSSSSSAPACPLRPRKRSMEDFIEVDSWMGLMQGRGNVLQS